MQLLKQRLPAHFAKQVVFVTVLYSRAYIKSPLVTQFNGDLCYKLKTKIWCVVFPALRLRFFQIGEERPFRIKDKIILDK